MIPLLVAHNPKAQIGICKKVGDDFIVTLDEEIPLHYLLNINIGTIQVMEATWSSSNLEMIKKFKIKAFTIKEIT